MSIKNRILIGSAIGVMLPVLLFLALAFVNKARLDKTITRELDGLIKQNTAQISQDVYSLVQAMHEAVQLKVHSDLNVARDVLEKRGGVNLGRETVSWSAMNQFTKSTTQIRLPKMLIGGRWLGQNSSFSNATPVVDDVFQLVGGTCTIFQRMNDQGDMLRVATNVRKQDDSRAIGTYIPAANPDGGSNEVIRSVLSGQTYYGRAYVVNAWYITAYEPIRDRNGEIIGMLYVGVKEESIESLRQAIMDITVGNTGYVYVLEGTGRNRGSYIISKNGEQDGKSLWNSQDDNGDLFIRDIVEKAVTLDPNEVAYKNYPWKNPGDKDARNKIAAFTYFAPWDWVIAAGTYEDDYYATKKNVASILNGLIMGTFFAGAIVLIIVIVISIGFVRQIIKPIRNLSEVSDKIAQGITDIEIDYNSKSELGLLADSFRELIQYLKDRANIIEEISMGNLDIDVEMSSEDDALAKSIIRLRNNIRMLSGEIDELIRSVEKGDFHSRGDVGQFAGEFNNLMNNINHVIEVFMGHLDVIPEPIMVMDKDFSIKYANAMALKVFEKQTEDVIGKKCYDIVKATDCGTENCKCSRAMQSGKTESGETEIHPGEKTYIVQYHGVPIKDSKGQVVGALEVVQDLTDVKMGQKKGEKIGDYQATEVQKLFERFVAMAEGDLTLDYSPDAGDEDTMETSNAFIGISEGMKATLDGLNEILSQVAIATDQMANGAQQVSDSSQALSQGATEQASSIEEITSSMSELGSQTKLNAENAGQASNLSTVAKGSASNGNRQMELMLEAMREIDESSKKIGKIIKAIDEIAFQTNLLALNAAVEAARAGVHGKGFAVVAEEVRNLAQRSANAARETTDLIEGSVSKVENGMKLADKTSEALNEIVDSVTKMTDIIGEIASASHEQALGIEEVNQGLEQIDQVTQTNAANAEESASASEELSSQALQLKQMLSKFTLRDVDIDVKQIKGSGKKSARMLTSGGENGWGEAVHSRGGGKSKVNSEEISPEDLIDLDDSDFGNF